MKPEPEVALLSGVWYDTTGASKVNTPRAVDSRPVIVTLIGIARPAPLPAAQTSCVSEYHDVVAQKVFPSLVVGVVATGPKLNPRNVIEAAPAFGELPLIAVDVTGASNVKRESLVPACVETVMAAFCEPWPLVNNPQISRVAVVHEAVLHMLVPSCIVGVGSAWPKFKP
jgi:hypothetical protein